MKRREFVQAFVGGAALWPAAAWSQRPTEKVYRIGILLPFPERDVEGLARLNAFRNGLAALGWQEGRNINLIDKWAGSEADGIKSAATRLASADLDLIVGITTPAVTALLHEGGNAPILFLSVSDPIGMGFVPSLASPGGRVTGFTNFEFSIGGKWLQTLRDIAPGVAHVSMLYNPDTAPYFESFFRSVQAGAPALSIDVYRLPVRDVIELEKGLKTLGQTPGSALVVITDVFTTANRDLITRLAIEAKVPSIYPFRFFAVSGGLMSYGFDQIEPFRRAASYADKLLKGAKPADLPIQQPTKFELVINLRTAKALGLSIPPQLLATADEVIE